MQGRWTNLENFGTEERKQSKNPCSPVKLESRKNDKKIIHPGRVRSGKLPAIVQEEATTRLVSVSIPTSNNRVINNQRLISR